MVCGDGVRTRMTWWPVVRSKLTSLRVVVTAKSSGGRSNSAAVGAVTLKAVATNRPNSSPIVSVAYLLQEGETICTTKSGRKKRCRAGRTGNAVWGMLCAGFGRTVMISLPSADTAAMNLRHLGPVVHISHCARLRIAQTCQDFTLTWSQH